MALGVQKVLQSIEQAAEKLRQASLWQQGQEEEMWLQQGRNQNPQIWNRPRKVRLTPTREPYGMHILSPTTVFLFKATSFSGWLT